MKRVLIVGAGGIGKRHIRGFLKTGRVALSICEPREVLRKSVCQEYAVERAYADMAEAPLGDFDLAVVAAPAHVHISLATTLAQAGIPFLLEKPLAVEEAGIAELLEIVRAKKLAVRVGYISRLRPWMQRVKSELDGGRLGNIHMAHVFSGQDFRKYRPDYAENYYARHATGGGAILDAATHAIDLLIWFMGRIREVSAIYDRLVFNGVECEDCALLNFRFASGGMASISQNQFQKPNEHQMDLIGDKGNFKIFSGEGRLQFAENDTGQWQDIYCNPFGGMSPMEIHEAMFEKQANGLLDVIEGHDNEMCSLDDAWHNLKVCLAAKRSYRDRSIIVVPERTDAA